MLEFERAKRRHYVEGEIAKYQVSRLEDEKKLKSQKIDSPVRYRKPNGFRISEETALFQVNLSQNFNSHAFPQYKDTNNQKIFQKSSSPSQVKIPGDSGSNFIPIGINRLKISPKHNILTQKEIEF